MKYRHDTEFEKAADTAFRVTALELRQFVERYERLEADKKEIADQQKELMAEARARGYDTKAMRQIVRERARSREEVQEEQAVLQLYRDALGM
ncbi:uncharacterized protein (UPF0335 family) [Albidovulum inexpectatum]|uniref:Uncharacterized protein (UPF0335 family) n=1 Tax=Albidovulum inexpectatum TaxID=196587 RepID=A0A2S5JEH2_9RHOB|nr:DUF2312 domain-containing protein [Albidovulum inexpectatum]PPB79778.1 uncharacterized protein (UPF0335 family) [Albidovulum inexpectatum]